MGYFAAQETRKFNLDHTAASCKAIFQPQVCTGAKAGGLIK